MTALDFTTIAPKSFTDAAVQALHDAMRAADGAWRAARAQMADEGLIRELARDFIGASYAFQKARFGKVTVKMSVASLLR